MQSNREAEKILKLLFQRYPYLRIVVKSLSFHRDYSFLHHILNHFYCYTEKTSSFYDRTKCFLLLHNTPCQVKNPVSQRMNHEPFIMFSMSVDMTVMELAVTGGADLLIT